MLSKILLFVKEKLGTDSRAEIALGSAMLFGAKVFGALSGYVLAFMLAQRGGAEAVGVFEIAFTFIILLSVVARFGLDGALVRYIGQFGAQQKHGAVRWLYRNSMRFSLVLSLALALTLYVCAPLLQVFGGSNLVASLRWAAAAIPFFTLMNMNGETLRGYKRMFAYSYLQQGSVIFIAAIIFMAWPFTDAGIGGVQAFFIASVLIFLLSIWQMRQQFSQVEPMVSAGISFNQVLKIARPIFLSSSIFFLISWTDTLMIGYFMNEADVGVYRIAFKVSTLITFTMFAINGIAAPLIAARYHSGDHDGLKGLIHNIGLFNFFMSVPIFLVIVLVPTFLLSLFGAEFGQGREVLLLLCAGQVVFALSGPVMYILTMTQHERTALYIMYVTAAINLLGNAILIPMYGIYGAAIATTASTIIWNLLAVVFVRKFIGVVAVPFIHSFLEKK